MDKILIIDDNESFRAFVATLLERAGYEVHELADGKRVEAFLATISFAAVITDLFMPGTDGLETVRLIKSVAPWMPVLGMTGQHLGVEAPCARAMTALGAAAVLSKPLDPEKFLATLRLLISRRA